MSSRTTNAGNPTGLLLAKPNAGILYATLAKGPKLPFEYQLNWGVGRRRRTVAAHRGAAMRVCECV